MTIFPASPELLEQRAQSVVEESAVNWHNLDEEDVLRRLAASSTGLTTEDVQVRQQRFGRNILPVQPPPTLFQIILHQFKSPLIYVLIVAGVVAILIGDVKDAMFIFAVVLLNASLGAFQEWRAEKSAAALQSLLKIYVRVRRDGGEHQIEAEDLVPGDIVLLESGNRVPADLRLLRVHNLTVDESLLTGESLAVQKQTAALDDDLALSDRINLAYAGSTIATGRGMGVVFATGAHTTVGEIAAAATAADTTKPPLVIRMERFARDISFAVLGACAALALIAVARGIPYSEVFFLAVALAVSVIPEGLPVALTVALSIATNRMAKRNVIVRKLTAVEGLGSCTYIASDKTGTLTVNKQTVRTLVLPDGLTLNVTGEGYTGQGEVVTERGDPINEVTETRVEALVRAGVMCNEGHLIYDKGAWDHHGDAVDIALLALGYKVGFDPATARRDVQVVAEIPFEPERRYAATAYRWDGQS
ncbi:MAG: HAD-IC family P-type ATPase [Caldilinea sp.]